MAPTIRLVIGIALLAVGVAIFLDRIEVWDFGKIAGTYWPLFLILLGVVQLATRSSPLLGVFVLVTGLFFQARQLGLLPPDWTAYVLPVTLVIVGLLLLSAPFLHRRRYGASTTGRTTHETVREQRIERTAILGGFETTNRADPFSGGTVKAILGGVNLDLQRARLPPEGADLEVTAVMGGVELQVPHDWKVDVRSTPILGGIDVDTEEPHDPEAPTLRVQATALLGGIEIHNPEGPGPRVHARTHSRSPTAGEPRP